VATDEPEIAAKPPQAAMVAIPNPALPVADKGVGGAEQFAADAGDRDEGAHQQEHRDDAEGIIRHRAHRGLADQFSAPAQGR